MRAPACLVFFFLLGPSAAEEPGSATAPARPPVFYETTTVTARPVLDASGSVSVLDVREIEASAARSASDVLRQVPGLNALSSGGRAGVTNAFLRGGDPNYTLVLLDGVPLNDTTERQGGAVNLEELPSSLVGHVEVVRGPLTSFYGTSALAGVVQVFTPAAGKARWPPVSRPRPAMPACGTRSGACPARSAAADTRRGLVGRGGATGRPGPVPAARRLRERRPAPRRRRRPRPHRPLRGRHDRRLPRRLRRSGLRHRSRAPHRPPGPRARRAPRPSATRPADATRSASASRAATRIASAPPCPRSCPSPTSPRPSRACESVGTCPWSERRARSSRPASRAKASGAGTRVC